MAKKKDLNETAFFILEQATNENPVEHHKNEAAVALGRLGGLKGGKARADKLTAEQRKAISQKAIEKRWSVPEAQPLNDVVINVIVNNQTLHSSDHYDVSLKIDFVRNVPASSNYKFNVRTYFEVTTKSDEVILKTESTQDFLFERWIYSQRGNEVIKRAIQDACMNFFNAIESLTTDGELMNKLLDYKVDFFRTFSASTLSSL